MLYLFDKDDNFITILSKEEGLVDTRFKDYQNHIPDESFVFNVKENSPLLKHIVGENQVAFYDRDNDLRLMRIKQLREVTTSQGGFVQHNIQAVCEPSFLELYDHFIEDKRITNGTAQIALNRAIEGSRYVGEVTVDLGIATDNFYWINGIDAIFKILATWGGALKDTITLNDENEIVERKIWIMQRLGADNGLIVEPDHNAEQIERKTLSYPITAMWGQGASLQIEDEEGEHTGGYTRYSTFEDVEWSKEKGDPVDKPKGQKWVGDPEALAVHGYLHNGQRKHRFGHFSDQDYEDPEELLWATWNALQQEKLPEIMHEATIYETDKKVSLGDTVTVLNRNYNKPIEIQSQITGLEYDILDKDIITIVVGKFVDMNENPWQKEIDDLRDEVKRPRPNKPIDNDSFPDVKPDRPINVTAHGIFQTIQLSWDYDFAVYISHYEVYGSRVADFVPDSQHLLYRGRVSSFSHEVSTDEAWYYYVRAVNTHGTPSDFSVQVSSSSVRITTPDIVFGSITADLLEDNLDLAGKLADGTLDWINEGPYEQIARTEARVVQNVTDRINEAVDSLNTDMAELVIDLDKINTTVQQTVLDLNDATEELAHQSTLISEVEQTAGMILQSVARIEGDLDDVEMRFTAFEQDFESIILSVSKLEGDLDDMTIGAVNLLYDTSRDLQSYRINPPTSFMLAVLEDIEDHGVHFGSYVTASVYLVPGLSEIRFRLLFVVQSGGIGQVTPYSVTVDKEGRYEISAKVPEDTIRIEIELSSSNANVGSFKELQLERGNKGTDWSMHPGEIATPHNVLSFINLSEEGVRIGGDRVHISGQTLIDEGVIGTAAIANLAVDKFHLKYGIIENVHIADATIEDGKVKNLSADKVIFGEMHGNRIRAGTLNVDRLTGAIATFIQDGWNGVTNSVQITGVGLVTREGTTVTSRLNERGHTFYRDSIQVGSIGTAGLHSYPSLRGLNFQLDPSSYYMAWSHKESIRDEYYTIKFAWYKNAQAYDKKGFNFNDDVSITSTYKLSVRTLSTTNYTTGDRDIVLINGSWNSEDGVWIRNSTTGGRLFIGNKSAALVDSNNASIQVGVDSTGNFVKSIDVYNRTYTSTSQMMRVTVNGVLGRSTSSRRYKLLEEPIPLDYARKFLDIDVKSWFDKRAAEEYALTLSEGVETEVQKVIRLPGVIAEDIHDKGLDMFVEYDEYGRPEGVSSNLPLLMLPILKEHDNEINKLKNELAECKARIQELEEMVA